ncbi:MAG TPA: hypothetical protein VGB14_09445 [Acidimicrobiales bacterium]|jgi:hypothetical protein
MTPPRPGCDLCEAARLTRWYAEDEHGWVADCEVCDVPMVVWREHGVDPPPEVLDHLLAMLGRAADERFGAGGWSLDRVMRQIPDHFHAHARDPGWWARRAQGVTAAATRRRAPTR